MQSGLSSGARVNRNGRADRSAWGKKAGVAEPAVADVDLVARAQSGDVEAYAALVQRYQALAVGLAAVVMRDPANAEDVAQEAFLKAYHALDRFRPGASFRAWLVRIVVNEARNARAGAQRRAVLHARFGEDILRVNVAASAEDVAVANVQQAALVDVLDGQREDDRNVLMYRYVFDLSEAEMAQALACSPGTVKSRLSRALARLREDLHKTAPLLALSPSLGTLVGESMSGSAGPLAAAPTRDLAAAVLHGIGAGGAPSAGSAGLRRPTLQQVGAVVAGGVVVVALAATGLLLSTADRGARVAPATQAVPVFSPVVPAPTAEPASSSAGTPPAVIVEYGGDLSDAQRQELALALGTAAPVTTDSVSRKELDATLDAAGLPVDGTERAISSAVVTCLQPGAGLGVRTLNVTQMPAAAYANALVTAGIADADVVVAAPPSTPMTGETALVGVLKAYPQCHPDQPPQASRLRLAYDQLHATAEIAQLSGAWDKAAAIMLRGAQVAITMHGSDEATLTAAADDAAAVEGLALDPPRRAEIVGVLSRLAGLDHGTYAHGYAIQQVGADEVRVIPLAGSSR